MNPKSMMAAITRIAIVALLLPVGMLAAQTDSDAISKLLVQVRTHAAEASDDATTLESYTRGNLHYQSHATQINRMKEHVNELIRDSNELTSLRPEGSPWQQEAIDRIQEILPQMASHLTGMINHLNDNKSKTHMPAYREYVRTNQRLIDKAHQTIDNFVDYDEARAKADSLEKQLQLPTEASVEK